MTVDVSALLGLLILCVLALMIISMCYRLQSKKIKEMAESYAEEFSRETAPDPCNEEPTINEEGLARNAAISELLSALSEWLYYDGIVDTEDINKLTKQLWDDLNEKYEAEFGED